MYEALPTDPKNSKTESRFSIVIERPSTEICKIKAVQKNTESERVLYVKADLFDCKVYSELPDFIDKISFVSSLSMRLSVSCGIAVSVFYSSFARGVSALEVING